MRALVHRAQLVHAYEVGLCRRLACWNGGVGAYGAGGEVEVEGGGEGGGEDVRLQLEGKVEKGGCHCVVGCGEWW